MAAGDLQKVVASSFDFIGDFCQITWSFFSCTHCFSLIYSIYLFKITLPVKAVIS